jgi:hypothetical protein
MALKAFAESTANLAKSLKAERDEAREQYNNLASEHMLAINKICGERDKTELDEEMKFHHRTHSELVNANCKILDSQNDAKQLADRLTALELHSTSELARLERERDEAQEKYATEATEHMLAVNKLCGERDEALSQIVQAECRSERFCQERDELIEENKKLNKEVDDLIRQRPLLIEDFKRERDEAREAFKEMWRSGDAFLPHVDSETINRWRKAAGWEETK